jgi:hypothetical protein
VLNYIDSEENEEYQRQRGYTEGISVRRPWRRRGVARPADPQPEDVPGDGYDGAALGVDSQNLNGANFLYESVGFRLVKRYVIYRRPLEL